MYFSFFRKKLINGSIHFKLTCWKSEWKCSGWSDNGIVFSKLKEICAVDTCSNNIVHESGLNAVNNKERMVLFSFCKFILNVKPIVGSIVRKQFGPPKRT